MEEEKDTISIVYNINDEKNYNYNRSEQKGITIKSNIADDELIECDISKTLVEKLLKESSSLKPDQLLLEFAELQKRGIESSIENLGSVELELKAKSGKINEALEELLKDFDDKSCESLEKIWEKMETMQSDILDRFKEFKPMIDKLESIKKSTDNINNWQMNNFSESLDKLIKIQNENPELLKFIAKNFKTEEKGEK